MCDRECTGVGMFRFDIVRVMVELHAQFLNKRQIRALENIYQVYFRITVEMHILDMISFKNRSRLRRLHFNNGISK